MTVKQITTLECIQKQLAATERKMQETQKELEQIKLALHKALKEKDD